MYDFEKITAQFRLDGDLVEVIPYGQGHINDTYLAHCKTNEGDGQRYIIQRINHGIFKDPKTLMANVDNITEFLRNKIKEDGGNPERETLFFIQTKNQEKYFLDEQGNYWRVYIFIDNAYTCQIVENPDHFYKAGKAFGRFQKLLRDFPVNKLYETIPDFHNTSKRLKDFKNALKKNAAGRASEIEEEIEFVLKRQDMAGVLVNLLTFEKLPLRVTHNDTKFNNILIDNCTGDAICVIDLDTVMPGLSLYDFGDAIRSGANTAEEDERDLSIVSMDLELFESYTRGFLEVARDFLTDLEKDLLAFSAILMTFECGMRFLGDYLNGDVYFKIKRDGHNLDRARVQFKLVKDMEEKYEKMKDIVERYR